MNESVIKKLFEKNIGPKTNIVREALVENGRVDYEIIFGKKRFAVEARGARSSEYSTIGRLVNAKRTYSHVYLLAPVNFLKKIWNTLQETSTLTDIGLMSVNNKGLHILKKPNPQNYYYKSPAKTTNKSTKKHMFVNNADAAVELHFKNHIFTVSGVAKMLKTSMRDSYHRIKRLKAIGMIEEVPYGGHPKTYKFVKSRKIGEVVEL